MIGTGKREAATITTIVMFEITPPAIIGEERSNGETMKTDDGKDTETTDALIRNGAFGKRIVGSQQKSTDGSRIEAYLAPKRNKEEQRNLTRRHPDFNRVK